MAISMLWPSHVAASCGAVTCFVVVGTQQQVPQAGLLTFNTIYNYTPMRLLDGTNGVISAVDQSGRCLILDHHQEIRTITQTVNFDLNYGITDRSLSFFSRSIGNKNKTVERTVDIRRQA